MLCANCGSKAEDYYHFCPHCGAEINHSDVSSGSTVQPPALPSINKKSMPLWFKFLATLAVLSLIAVSIGILLTESWVDVVERQLDALQNDDIFKAYTAYTSKDFQATTSLDQFRSFIEAYPIFLDHHSAHFSQRSIEDNIRTLRENWPLKITFKSL